MCVKTPQVGHHVQFVWKPSNFSTHYLENLSTLLVNKFYRISLWTFAVNTSCFGHWFHFFWIPLNFRELLSFIKEQVLVSEEKLSTFNVNTLYFWTPLTLFWKPLNFFLKLKKRGGSETKDQFWEALGVFSIVQHIRKLFGNV